MTFLKFALILSVGLSSSFVVAFFVNAFGHYEIPLIWPLIIAGVGSGAGTIAGWLIRKRELGCVLIFILVALLSITSFVEFKTFRYHWWYGNLISQISKEDTSFAQLPPEEKEADLNAELVKATGHSGFLAYLFFPRMNIDLDIELVEDTGIGFPIHIALRDAWAVGARIIGSILELVIAVFSAFYPIVALERS